MLRSNVQTTNESNFLVSRVGCSSMGMTCDFRSGKVYPFCSTLAGWKAKLSEGS
jgi:hypothetical protein